jgi:hypothetical protein
VPLFKFSFRPAHQTADGGIRLAGFGSSNHRTDCRAQTSGRRLSFGRSRSDGVHNDRHVFLGACRWEGGLPFLAGGQEGSFSFAWSRADPYVWRRRYLVGFPFSSIGVPFSVVAVVKARRNRSLAIEVGRSKLGTPACQSGCLPEMASAYGFVAICGDRIFHASTFVYSSINAGTRTAPDFGERFGSQTLPIVTPPVPSSKVIVCVSAPI